MAPDPLASQVDRYHRALGQQENGSPSSHLAQCIQTQEPLLWSVSQSRLYDPLSYGRQNNAFAKLELLVPEILYRNLLQKQYSPTT